MKIAITSEKDNLQSSVASDIKHTDYFLVFNTEDQEIYKFIPNMYNKSISGAEIFCSQFLIEQGIDLLICGKYDYQASKLLILAGIKIDEKPGVKLNEIINHIIKHKKENNYES